MIAFVRPTRPTRYQGLGDVYAELHFVPRAGAGVVVWASDLFQTTNRTDSTDCYTDASTAYGHSHCDRDALPVFGGVQLVIVVAIPNYFVY